MGIHIIFLLAIPVIAQKPKEFDPRKTQCDREPWLFDEDVVRVSRSFFINFFFRKILNQLGYPGYSLLEG